ncbi:leukocyte-associated immunoglobulin-like receptor 1 isoform X3 [Canis lupus baileyi]|uniref:leukocyte-associated immunoglobulin-like receptor 1 isoform X3 n=1 Tax=Canis lupus baileyi TaxID=143281 RepID=UPI003B96AD07
MFPHVTTFLALTLCLGGGLHAQQGVLPSPSIWAQPSSEIPRGQPVTIVCQGPAGAETFRLEKEGSALHKDVRNPQHETQARFPIPAVGEDTARRYRCLYNKDGTWSDRSKELQLVVTEVSPVPRDDSSSLGPSSSKGEEQRTQERVSPAVDIRERTPDLATISRLPERDREGSISTPTAGGPQDVTYAQLDHHILTQRTAPATSPQSVEPMAESSTYAALARH